MDPLPRRNSITVRTKASGDRSDRMSTSSGRLNTVSGGSWPQTIQNKVELEDIREDYGHEDTFDEEEK